MPGGQREVQVSGLRAGRCSSTERGLRPGQADRTHSLLSPPFSRPSPIPVLSAGCIEWAPKTDVHCGECRTSKRASVPVTAKATTTTSLRCVRGTPLGVTRTMTAAECISSANDLLAAHAALLGRIRQTQKAHRRQLRALASPPHDILSLPLIPSPEPSPPVSRSPSPLLPPKPRQHRPDLPPAKRARVARYENYVPEEETIRNDYSQRYVDGGEWPQNWVLGADPEHRFEECVS